MDSFAIYLPLKVFIHEANYMQLLLNAQSHVYVKIVLFILILFLY